jgi:hypothetical protein
MTARKNPEMVDLPPIGVELLQAIDAANQRFRDWASGYLAGKGVTAAYAPQGTPEGVKLIRQAAPEEPTPDSRSTDT